MAEWLKSGCEFIINNNLPLLNRAQIFKEINEVKMKKDRGKDGIMEYWNNGILE